VDTEGYIGLLGQFYGKLNFGNGEMVNAGAPDIFIAQLSPSGTGSWSRRIGDSFVSGSPVPKSLGVDNAGSLSITGVILSGQDFGDGKILRGATNSQDAFIAKYNKAGQFLWARRDGAGGSESAQATAFGPLGVQVVVGYFQDLLDLGTTAMTTNTSTAGFVATLSK
jgi:hypothetical protein